MKRLDTNEFIKRATEKHGDRYDYSKSVYVKRRSPLIIICKEHGEFLQSPDGHYSGRGCQKCANNVKFTNEHFIKLADGKHGYKYNYSKVNYINNRTPVIIICEEHGEFLQSPEVHLRPNGCKKCSGQDRMTTQKFIKQSTKTHGDRYDYSQVCCSGKADKVIIGCSKHGYFQPRADNHINGSNCYVCVYENREGSYKAGNIRNWGHLDGFFYIVELINIDTNEIFKKFGISKEPDKRFKAYDNYKLNKVITCESMKLKDAYNLETSMKKDTIQYIPKQKFGGYTECFQSYIN